MLDKKTKQESYEREERMQFGIKLHETKLKLHEELRNKNTTSETAITQTAHAKLPKLNSMEVTPTGRDFGASIPKTRVAYHW